jgi:hypothetical protein
MYLYAVPVLYAYWYGYEDKWYKQLVTGHFLHFTNSPYAVSSYLQARA